MLESCKPAFSEENIGKNRQSGLMNELKLATLLAWTDIRLQYRRSTLGPFWISLTVALQITVIGLLFSSLFSVDLFGYLLYLGTGLIFWSFFTASINDGAQALIVSGGLLKQVSLSSSVYIFRSIIKNLLVLSHNLVVLIPLYVLAEGSISFWSLLVIPGIVLVAANLAWLATILSVVSARYRDLPSMVSALLMISFYATPILWRREQMAGTVIERVIPLNPFFHLLEVVRSPMLGEPTPLISTLFLLGSLSIGLATSAWVFKAKSRVIPYWV